jgi:hypothetical protein
MEVTSDEPTYDDRMHAAYMNGKRARLKKNPVECPHEEGTPAHKEWQRGFKGEKEKKV